MGTLARLVSRHPRKIVLLWCLLALGGAYLGLHLEDRLQNGGYDVSGSQTANAAALGREHFHDKSQAQAFVSIAAPGASLQVLLRDARMVRQALRPVRGVDSVGTAEIAHNRRAVLVPVLLGGSVGEAQSRVPALERALGHVQLAPAKARLVGQVLVFDRYLVNGKKGLLLAALISFPVTLLILLIAFLSVPAAVLPLLLAGGSLGVTFGGLYLLTYVAQLSVFVEDTVLVVGLGLSIDFSLFIVTRVRECLARGSVSVEQAVAETLGTTGRAVLVSGLTVAASLSGLFLSGLGFLGSLAIGAIGATLLALAAALTLAPAAILLLGERLDRLSVRSSGSIVRGEARWRALAGFAIRRRLAVVCVTVPVLVALSLPVLGMHIRFKTFSILPANDPVRAATAEVEKTFGSGFGGPVVVLAKASGEHLEEVVEAAPGIAQIGAAESGSGGWRRLSASLTASPDSDRAEGLVDGLRRRLRHTLGQSAIVGGPTAEAVDVAGRINSRTPIIALAILLVEMIFLTFAFRAPLVALKAALTTLLSVTATLGLLSVIFGGNDKLAFFVPLLLLATTFGLSTDYEIFLLSRVREHYRQGETNTESIKTALVRSARSITLAGITMSAVFFAFATSPLRPFTQLGVGLGIAVLLDVTVVRSLLVPATLALLGDLNWWRPRWRSGIGHMSKRDETPTGSVPDCRITE